MPPRVEGLESLAELLGSYAPYGIALVVLYVALIIVCIDWNVSPIERLKRLFRKRY
jgi:hypothetical protein